MSHLSTLTLHRLRYGELDPHERDGAHAHLQVCPRCAERLAVQETERTNFVLEPVPERLRVRTNDAGDWFRGLLRVVLPLAALAATVTVALTLWRGATDADDTILLRGTALPEIEAWVDSGAGPRPLRDGEALGAGDRVQLRYDSHGAHHVALAGRDASGLVEVYTLAAPSGTEGLTTAPFALELDAAPGQQELFVVTSSKALDEPTVKAALSGPVDGVTVSRVAFPKRVGQ